MNLKYWKKAASNLKQLVLWRNLDSHDNIDKRWKENRKSVLISHKLEHFILRWILQKSSVHLNSRVVHPTAVHQVNKWTSSFQNCAIVQFVQLKDLFSWTSSWTTDSSIDTNETCNVWCHRIAYQYYFCAICS